MTSIFLAITLTLACLTMGSNSFAQDKSSEDKNSSTTQKTSNDQENAKQDGDTSKETKTNEPAIPEALNFKMKTIDGKEVELSQYVGKVVVIVNTASRCGLTPQYKDLQELHKKYADQGVVVLGFPCNQFGGQEPGTEADIKIFCSKNYGVEFDMFAKVDVNGDKACDLFKFLTAVEAKPAGAGKVRWNFEKFVLDKSGNLVARFGSRVEPSSDEFIDFLEEQIAKEGNQKESKNEESKADENANDAKKAGDS